MTSKKVNFIAKIGILSAVAFLLQLIGSIVGLKIGGFLEVEASDFPAIIASLALGPVAGLFVELIKNILHLSITSTGAVGELANFLINGTFIFIIGIVYNTHKSKKRAMLALLLGTITMTAAAMLANYFILLPLYMQGVEKSIKIGLILSTITPFNLARGVALSIITLLTYKSLSPVIHGKR